MLKSLKAKTSRAAAFGLALALSTLGGATQSVASGIPVDDDFSVFGLNWSSGGQLYLVAAAREYKGKTMVCGVQYAEGPVPGIVNIKYIRGAKISSGGKVLVTNLTYFTDAKSGSALKSGPAACKLTRHNWKPSYGGKLDLRGPRRVEY